VKRLADLTTRRPRLVLLLLASIGVVAAGFGWSLPSHLSNSENDFRGHGTESFETSEQLHKAQGRKGFPDLAVITRGDPDTKGENTQAALEAMPEIGSVQERVYDSEDKQSSSVIAYIRKGIDDEGAAAASVAERLEKRPGVTVGGSALLGRQFDEQIRRDLVRAELIAFPLLLLLALWVFRSLVAALLPVTVGMLALVVAMAALRVVDDLFSLSIFSLNIALGLALGLAVDYSLLMVSRFREELSNERSSPMGAARTTLKTAGRTVALSSATVAASFSSLLVFPIPFVRSIATCGILVALIAGAIALSLLPAAFVLLGGRVNALAPAGLRRIAEQSARPQQAGFWYRLARFVMRRPVAVALTSAVLLLSLGIPSLGMKLTGLDATVLPETASAREFDERVRKDFSHPVLGEVIVAINGDFETRVRVTDRIEQRVGSDTDIMVIKHKDNLWQANINPQDPPFSDETKAFVRELREIDAPMTVAGETAAYVDTEDTLRRYLPLCLFLLGTFSFVLLLIATRSVLLPLKAIVMNLLSLAAAFGILVLVFQDGRFESALQYETQGALGLTLPIILGAGAFGLLTDYGLFLLTRIREAHDLGHSNREAVALGLERTGRIVTAAALLFCVAVGSFATSEIIFIKEAAIGIVAAVAIDASIVRALFVPSLMALLGKWNWWYPNFRRRPA
jgi:uncharacterized membrane protein YdfJ with MMPL/SSD domain